MTSRRNFMRIAGTSAVILAAGAAGLTQCDPMPEAAVEGWKGPLPSIRDPRVRALSFALLAPNPAQSSTLDRGPARAGCHHFPCDRSRLLPETDPYSRQITIGCGAFLELLRMAAAEQGYRAEMSPPFPQGTGRRTQVGDAPVCRITLVRGHFCADLIRCFDAGAQASYQARGLRNGTRRRRQSSLQMQSSMAQLPVMFGATVERKLMERLRDIARRAWHIEARNDSTYLESVKLFRITGPEIARQRDGLSFHGPFFWWMHALGLFTREKQPWTVLPATRPWTSLRLTCRLLRSSGLSRRRMTDWLSLHPRERVCACRAYGEQSWHGCASAQSGAAGVSRDVACAR
jgi:hypothetical protein